jgi:hypothetical protein
MNSTLFHSCISALEEDSTVVSLIVLTEEWQKQDGKLAKHFSTTAQPVALEVKRSYS